MAIQLIDVHTLKQLMADGHPLAVVDVREPDEYAAAHIAGAIPLPLGNVENLDLKPLAGKKLIMQCLSGRRSDAACQKLTVLHPDIQIFNLEGGISAWMNAGYPVECL